MNASESKGLDSLAWRQKKGELRSEGYLVRTHIEQMPIHKNYQIYVRGA